MSHNQSRAERIESSQYRKSGRSIHHRNFSGGGTKGSTGAGGGATAPTNTSAYNSNSSQPSLSFNRSYKKHNNVQGGIPRGSAPSGQAVNSDSINHSAPRAVQNGAHSQLPSEGASDVPVTTVKPTDVATPKATRAPRAPSSNVPAANSEPKPPPMPVTPAKVPAEASRSFPLQFGSISPGLMNGMQIPARTSSAPPNLDEQKRDQARYDTLRAPPAVPNPSIPRQQLPKKDAGSFDQANATEIHPTSKPKKNVQVSAPPPVSQTQKPSMQHPIPGMPVQMSFHQPQVPVQFGGPNPQIQSQAMSTTSLPMPMPMPMPLQIGNPSVQQPVFVPGLQPHPMQSQGILHQGQNLNFTSQMGPQIPPQLGNIGISIAPQFPQQQPGKFGGTRKAVKITHPDTHEELRLDGSAAPRSHPNVPPQSQPISSFPPAHPPNYYPHSYSANPMFFPAPSSLPLNTSLPAAQPQRYYSQITVKPAVSSHGEKDTASLASSPRAPKGEPVKLSRPSQKDAEASSQSFVQQSKPGFGSTSKSVSEAIKSAVPSGSDFVQCPAPNSLSPGFPVEKLSASPKSGEGLGLDIAGGLDSANSQQKKVDGQFNTVSVLSPQESEIVGVKMAALSATSMVLENPTMTMSTASMAESNAFDSQHEKSEENKATESSKIYVVRTVEDNQPKAETSGQKDQGEATSAEDSKRDNKGLETSLESSASEPAKFTSQNIESSALKGRTPTSEASSRESLTTVHRQLEESVTCHVENDNLVTRSSIPDTENVEVSASAVGVITQEDKISSLDFSLGRPASIDTEDTVVTNSAISDKESVPVSLPSSEEILKYEEDGAEDNTAGSISSSASGIKEKSLAESNVAKSTAPRKKKIKELLKQLDSSGPTSDLYLAYKGPEEKKESVISAEITENASNCNLEAISSDVSQKDLPKEKGGHSKAEPDDWEDAADMSTPKLDTSENGNQVDGSGEDGNGAMTKKYSRDFLLKFSVQCTDLPEDFEFAPDKAEALISSNVNVSRESYPSSGRSTDRSRLDRRGSGLGEEDKWNKFPGSLMNIRDIGYGPNMDLFRSGPGNHGVLRNPRMQTPLQYPGGILAGQMQPLFPQVGVPRNSPDSERWQRGTAFQKGLMPSPQTPLQVMHKAERKYEVGKVSDEEEAKQRQLKAILNKLTPQNFEILFEQVKQVNIDNAVTLTGVISQIFDKALMEPTFCEMYANFCHHLAAELPDLSVDNEKITFKRLLLNKCQEEFERGEREQEEANKADVEGEAKRSAEEREQKRLRARRRMLGNIRLIGELYKKRMLTERIMHECIKKLLGQYQNPDEEDVEALCKLMSTIGEMIDHPKAKEHMDAYFDMMANLSNNTKLSSRVRFMLKDAIDLRKNKWQQRRKVEGPKKIEEVHRDAAQERQAQSRGLARAPSMGSSVRRGQPIEFSPRGTNILASPSSQMGGFRGVPPQLRGYGAQDVRMDERHTLSVPLPQRPLGDDSITLGPQGGLARGMSFRGQSASPGIQLSDVSSIGDSRRVGPGLNGFNPVADRTVYASRDDPMQRYLPDRFGGSSAYDQSSTQDRNMAYGNRDVRSTDRAFDRSLPMSPPGRSGGSFTQNVTSEKVWPEERLRDMSMSAIKEFYSAKDENEIALCIKDLNNPNFYPSMISLWVTDSFERKDMERELLAKLLVTLTKYPDGTISQDQLIKGFDSVLMTLEDAVNDAPKAGEFLGCIFAKVILENVIPFNEIARLIYEGGEEQGRLVEIGLAAEVLGTILDIIKSERGDSVLDEIRLSSNLRIENFRPPGSNKTRRLDKFI